MRQPRIVFFAMGTLLLFAMSGVSAAESIPFSSTVAPVIGSINAFAQFAPLQIVSGGSATADSFGLFTADPVLNRAPSPASEKNARFKAEVAESDIASPLQLHVREQQAEQAAVPEPSTIALVFSGLIAAGSRFRKYSRNSNQETV